MKGKEHKRRAIEALENDDIICIEETDDIKDAVGKFVKMKAVEIGAVAPDRIEFEFDLKHRGFLHSEFILKKIEEFLEISSNNSDPIFQYAIKPFLIGYSSHLREDKKTKMGIPNL